MRYIGTVQAAVTAAEFDREPTFAELETIEHEMPVIRAEVEMLDAQIRTLDRPVTELDNRRIRRARNRVLAARRDLINRTAGAAFPGGAA
ncbi:DUF6284 family protein [Streptomyces sp. H39-S7]|uniref:DUF6284 family protein n=1 Tax=Streptomyces sp. H39-S7 TaxID=3004357 RepID=UPI0022AEF58C|nr:DUF6284 family protein [Streptomyces sp. H39-S7]MCZ4125290.1 DUF6284 family protein [Streptomyces sp. H39-S7]